MEIIFMSVVLFILGVIGITHIVVDSKVFKPIRDFFLNWPPEWLKNLATSPKLPALATWALGHTATFLAWFMESMSSMLHCYQCAGFWCGFICSFWMFEDITIWQAIVAGGVGSWLANFAAIVMNYFDAQTLIVTGDMKNGR